LLSRPEGIHERPLLPVPRNREGWIEVSIRMPSIESTVHDLLALGPGVEVIKPVELRDQLHRAAVGIADANAGSPPVTRR
jgi:predicted DNA-binding transcriptional regulator YafY